MENKTMTHEESLNVIQGMISTAKNTITDKGFHFLLWGVLVILASLTQYFLISQGYGNESNFVWMAMCIIGVPTAMIYEWKRDKTTRVRIHSDRFYGLLWLGFGLTLGCTIFIQVNMHTSPQPQILSLVGFATFASGCLYRFKPLILGGILFWISAVISSFVPGPEQLLINAAATLFGYIVPGIALWRKSKNAHV